MTTAEESTAAEPPPPRLRPVQLALGVLGAGVVGVLVVTGIGRLAGYRDLRQALVGLDPGWLALCLAGQLVVFTGYVGVLRGSVDREVRVRLAPGTALAVVLASFAATQLFAFAGVGGLAVMYWALRRVGVGGHRSAVLLIGINTAVYVAFAAIGVSAALWALTASQAPLAMTVPWLLGVPAVLLVARWFTAPVRVHRWTQPAPGWRRRALAVGVAAAAWVRNLPGDRVGRRILGWALVYWFGNIVSLGAGLAAVGARPALGVIPLVFTTGYLAQSLPIPLIATGGVDAATTFLLEALGVPLELALAGVVVHRVFAFWVPVIPGIVLALLLPRTGRALVATAAGS